jgi:tripartite-type tricarboxylate transporter receptor subunit TctC
MKTTLKQSYFAPVAFGLATLLAANIATAETPKKFFEGRTIKVIIGSKAGNTYDIYARMVTKKMAEHLPGKPIFVPLNMPAASSVAALNHLYNAADRNGSVIGAINPGAIAAPILQPKMARYDSRKFNWLGSVVRETEVIAVWHNAPVQSLNDAFKKEIIVGGTGGASSVLPKMINEILGTKFKVIEGYKGSGSVFLAMRRGEVQGIGATSVTNLKWRRSRLMKEKKLRVIAHYGLSPNDFVAGVPTVMDLVKDEKQAAALRLVLTRQEIGRTYLAPPGVPRQIVAAYRAAFDKTMSDPSFIAEVGKRKLDLDPQNHKRIAELVASYYKAPADVVTRVRKILGGRT